MESKEFFKMIPMERMTLSSRYLSNTIHSLDEKVLIEFPKTIDRKRVLDRAWSWFNGNGASRIPNFVDALKASWKQEIDMIREGGWIYYPYIMSEIYNNIEK